MRRTILMSALAVVLPITRVAVSGGSASAKNMTDPITCTGLGGQVQSAGLSAAGATEAKKKPSKRHWTA